MFQNLVQDGSVEVGARGRIGNFHRRICWLGNIHESPETRISIRYHVSPKAQTR